MLQQSLVERAEYLLHAGSGQWSQVCVCARGRVHIADAKGFSLRRGLLGRALKDA